MGIFDRLGRIARSEVSELKRVLREAREEGLPDPVSEEAERDRLIAEAEAELARAEEDVLGAEIDAGAALWGRGADGAPASGEAVPGPDDPELSRGADLWARAGSAPTRRHAQRALARSRAPSRDPVGRTPSHARCGRPTRRSSCRWGRPGTRSTRPTGASSRATTPTDTPNRRTCRASRPS